MLIVSEESHFSHPLSAADLCIQDWPTAYRIIRGTCEGLHYLHERQGGEDYIHHLELKSDNILLDKNMIPRNEETGSFNLLSASKTHGTSTVMKTE
jgi:pyruvate dehydrogenase phosphatase